MARGNFQYTTTTVALGASTSGEVPAITDKLNGSVLMPAVMNGTSMTFVGASAQGGTYVPILSAGGTSAASISASSSQGASLPADVFNYGSMKINMSSTQAQAITIGIFLKS